MGKSPDGITGILGYRIGLSRQLVNAEKSKEKECRLHVLRMLNDEIYNPEKKHSDSNFTNEAPKGLTYTVYISLKCFTDFIPNYKLENKSNKQNTSILSQIK